MKVHKNTTGTTSRWVNTACQLAVVYGGPRWFFTEIAAIALAQDAHRTKTGGAYDKERPALGPQMHYGNWVAQTRVNAANASWWTSQRSLCSDQHSKAAWLLAAALVAPAEVIAQLLRAFDTTISELDDDHMRALLATSERIGTDRLGRRLAGVPSDVTMHAGTRLLVAHHSERPEAFLGEDLHVLNEISRLPAGRNVAAAAATILAGKFTNQHTLALVESYAYTAGATPGIEAMTDAIAQAILARADRMPPEWVAQADRYVASQNQLQPLRAVAESIWELN
jgi:hypothetical protein